MVAHGWHKLLPLSATLALSVGFGAATTSILPESASAQASAPGAPSQVVAVASRHRHLRHGAVLCAKHRRRHGRRHSRRNGRRLALHAHHHAAHGRCTRNRRRHAGRTNAKLSGHGRNSNLARLASGSCANTTLMPTAGNVATIRGAILCLVDRERARSGEHPLHANGHVQLAAQRHNDDMVAREYFEHVSPSGESLAERLRASGYIYSSNIGYALGENIAWGTLEDATPQAIVAAWMASPGHRANILDASFRDTGIGVAPSVPRALGEGQAGAMYTQDFGLIIAP